jgi:hypothetical protein
MSRPQSKYVRVDASNPEASGQCDRCSRWRNMSDLEWQFEWSGTHLYNLRILVCREFCLDVPQEQLRTIVLPPDPPPVLNARVPNFAYEESTVIITQFATSAPKQPAPNSQPPWGTGPAQILCTQDGEMALVLQYLTSS